MADLKISELAALAGANLAAGDLLPVVDVSASETKKITIQDAIGYGVTLIADATIPGGKILFGAGTIAGSAIANGGVGATQLADDAVTAAKLGNESTVDLVTTLPGSGAYTGQLALDTDDLKIYCWDGSAWRSIKAAGSVNTVVGDTAGIVNLTVTTSGDQVTITTSLDNTNAAAQFLAGPAANAGAVSYRTITGADLPTATSSAKGGVIVNGEGLRLDGSTIEVDNDVTLSATHHVVTYNAKGLVTAGRTIIGTDLPAATSSVKGAVIPGTGLAVDGSGTLNHSNTATPGTYTKVTIDSQGHVTAGDTLADTDVPNHSAAKLTSGTLDIARIGSNTITGVKLANSSTAQFGASQPIAEYTGQLYFNSLSRDIYIWDGNVWQPIGISVGEIVFAGTYDANTNLVASVTSDGTAVGLVVGQALPAAATANNRYYLVVAEAGTGTAPAPTVALSPPDIILSNGSAWTEIDVSQTITSQVAANVSFTPAGDISATNVQAAIEELDTEKLPKAGGTVTGELLIGTAGTLAFEGSTDNAFETRFAVADPTADRTITLPDRSGTVITTGDTGTVTSTMIADGTIADVDISATAEIAVSKLADGSARQLLQTDAAGTGVEWTSNVDIPGTLDVTGVATFDGIAQHPSGSAAAPSITFTGDVNTGLYSPAADELAVTTAGAVRLTVDGTGKVLVGTSTALSNVYAISTVLTPALQVEGNSGSAAAVAITRHTSAAANLLLQRGVTGTPVADTEAVGQLNFNGFDGTNYINAALIRAVVEGTPGTGSMPGRLSFQTTASGSSTATERLRLDSAGQILAASLGTASLPVWSFTGDPNTGVYSPGADQLAMTTGGTARVTVASTGRVTVANSSLGTPSALGNQSGTITLDLATANHFSFTLNANSTNTLANPSNQTAGQSGVIVITQDGTGSRTLAYGSNWKFPGGTAPTLTTAANAVDVIAYYVESATRITARLISDVK